MVDTKTGDTGCDGRCVLFPDEQLVFWLFFFDNFVVIVARESAGSCAVVSPGIQSTGKTHHFCWLEFHLCQFTFEILRFSTPSPQGCFSAKAMPSQVRRTEKAINDLRDAVGKTRPRALRALVHGAEGLMRGCNHQKNP